MAKIIQNMLERRISNFVKCQRHASTTLSNLKGTKENVKALQSLPKLPVPPLQPSLEKYLRSIRPFLSEEEYGNTCRKVKEFGAPNGLGVKLHKLLQERAEATDNWLREWWLQSAYLEERNSLLVTSVYAVYDLHQHFRPPEDRIRRVSRMTAGALAFKQLIDNNTLEPEKYDGKVIDMSQYNYIFTTCRNPGSPVDSHMFENSHNKKPKHIAVVHNNNYFSVNVYKEDGKPFNQDEIFTQLQKVLSYSQKPEPPIGILTALDRDRWSKVYKKLKKYDPENEKSLSAIEKSVLVLCLDKMTNKKYANDFEIMQGEGAEENSGNRWFDKSLQVIAKRDGGVNLGIEHSPADGNCLQRLLAYMIDYNEKTESSDSSLPEPVKLHFKLSPEILLILEEAKENIKSIIEDSDSETNFRFDLYGKEFIKHHKMNPDSFIQMAFQLAFYKVHSKVPAAYETGSTRKFFLSRTETVRSTSEESVEFCKKMTDITQTPESKLIALRNAVKVHTEYVVQAMNGMGIDRLFLGMKKLVIENKMDMPEIFKDVAFTKSTYFQLSTSQISYTHDTIGLLPPWVPDGYAIFYNPTPSYLVFSVTASNSCPETGTKVFLKALAQALTEMHDVMVSEEN